MTPGPHLTCANFFTWSLSHQSLQHEAMTGHSKSPTRRSATPAPSIEVLVSAEGGGLAVTHLHHINALSEKSQGRKTVIKHQDLSVPLA